jgi:hypothetical protein
VAVAVQRHCFKFELSTRSRTLQALRPVQGRESTAALGTRTSMSGDSARDTARIGHDDHDELEHDPPQASWYTGTSSSRHRARTLAEVMIVCGLQVVTAPAAATV